MIAWIALVSAEPIVDRMNTALTNADYPAAETAIRELLAVGDTAGDVWYNLGNVLYRQGRLAEAAHAWRTADVRLPRDPDVDANLELVRRSFRDGLVADDPAPWFAPWQGAMTVEEGMWLGGLLAGAGLLAFVARRRRPEWPLVGIGAAGTAVGLLFLAGALTESAARPVGVVVNEEVVVTSDLSGGIELFTLHAGAEVSTIEETQGRTLVGLPDGRKGWLASTSLLLVDPAQPPAAIEVL